MKLCGKAIPAKDTLMTHYVDRKTGRSIIICHSANPDIFNLIGNTAHLIGKAREQKRAFEGEYVPDNYWEEKSKEAERYGMPTVAYLSVRNEKIPERRYEYLTLMANTSDGIKRFSSLVKRAMIGTKQNSINTVRDFFNERIAETGRSNENKREANGIER